VPCLHIARRLRLLVPLLPGGLRLAVAHPNKSLFLHTFQPPGALFCNFRSVRAAVPARIVSLERVLSSTNLIENLFSRVRGLVRRVKRWRGGTMVLRWSAAGVLEAERSFRKIVGYRAMPILVAALRAHDAKIDRAPTVDDTEKAA
jgi:hypothetical protein